MATAILYYSLSGKTKAYAEKTAAETGAALFEICEVKKRNGFTAFIPGCFQAGGMKHTPVIPPETDLSSYDEIIVMGPIWAGHAAPAVNSITDLLPEGKRVSLICTSGRGGYDLSKTAALITAKGCTITETRCLKAEDVANLKRQVSLPEYLQARPITETRCLKAEDVANLKAGMNDK